MLEVFEGVEGAGGFGGDSFKYGTGAGDGSAEVEGLIEAGLDAGYAGDGLEFGGDSTPVGDAVLGDFFEYGDVGGGSEEVALEGVAESGVDGKGDDECGDTSRDAADADKGDDRDSGLLALGAEVAQGDKNFKQTGQRFHGSIARNCVK